MVSQSKGLVGARNARGAPVVFALVLLSLVPGMLGARGALQTRGYVPGETLHYQIKWGLVTAGHARMEVREEVWNGRRVHRFTSSAQNTPVLRTFFPVKNEIISLFDPVRRRTLFNSKSLREGKYRRDYQVRFDHAAGRATFQQREFSGNKNEEAAWKEESGTTENLPDEFQDMLTAIYFNRSFRGQTGGPGTSFTMPVYDDLKMTSVKMEILERTRLELDINGKSRTLPALKIRPLKKTSGLFRSKGETRLYISDDAYRVILRVESTVQLAGSIKLLLHRVEGLPGF